MITLCDVFKDNRDEFITLNVNVSDLGSHSSPKYASTLWISGYTMENPMTGIDPENVDFSVYSCYFELDDKTNTKLNTLLKDVVSAGNFVSDTMFIPHKVLPDTIFCYNKNECVKTCTHQSKYHLLWNDQKQWLRVSLSY